MTNRNFDPDRVDPGSKGWGYVNVVDNLAVQFDMPVMVLNGATDGPALCVTAGLFPLEFCGVEAAARLYQSIDPGQMAGKLVIIPVVNMPVFQFRTPMFNLVQSTTLMDGKSINSVFPGDPAGSASEILAHFLFENFIVSADYHVDLRGGDLPESHLDHAIYLTGIGELDVTLREMGEALGFKYNLTSRTDVGHTSPGTLVYEAIARGVPSVISESGLGFNTQPTEKEVAAHVTGVTNLLIHFNMLSGDMVLPDEVITLEPDIRLVRTDASGIFQRLVDQSDIVEAGQTLGHIVDLDGTVLREITAPEGGVIHEMLPRRVVFQGDLVYTIVVPIGA